VPVWKRLEEEDGDGEREAVSHSKYMYTYTRLFKQLSELGGF
jgi:hypothetical protein